MNTTSVNGTGDDRTAWTAKIHEVARAIEARGVGMAQAKNLGKRLAINDEPWYGALLSTNDIHEQRAVERAFAEWADGDAIAAHVAYGLEIFCSADVGNSNATSSILDPLNRAWLTSTYGVKFMTFDELLATLP